MRVSRRVILTALAATGLGGVPAFANPVINILTLKHPDGRATTYRAMAPSSGAEWPIILFSHGANSSHLDYDRLWSPWARRGYFVIGPNHIDTGPPATQLKVTPSELWRARLADTALPLRQRAAFEAVARASGGSLDWRSVCAAGHSFGAVVAQALVGAKIVDPGDHASVVAREREIGACLVFSPPGPLPNFIPADAWASVTTPSLLQTGDLDMLPGFVNDWRLRLTGFPGPPDRWTIVARGVDHYFGGLICRRKPEAAANLPAMEETANLSADFLDAYLRRRRAKLVALRARASRGDDGILTFAQV